MVAAGLAHFLNHLLTPHRKMGIAAVVLFAIVFRLRVTMWYADMSEGIVERYAHWAVVYIQEHTAGNAIACKVSDGHLSKCDPDKSGQDMTHWVGARPVCESWDDCAESEKLEC